MSRTTTTTTRPPPTDLPIYSFSCASDFETFLEREHTSAPGFHLKLAKKSSGIPSISGAEAIEVALCFGWIDGRANGLNEDWWLVRYTPRRPKSIWSQKNVDTVGRLLIEERMRPAGIAAIEAAQADGRWDKAYAGPATITVPDDFSTALDEQPAAKSFFETLNKSGRYSVLWRLHTGSTQTRSKRMKTMVQMLAEGKCPGDNVKSVVRKDAMAKHSTARKVVKNTNSAAKKPKGLQSVQNSQTAQPRRSGLRSRTRGLDKAKVIPV